MSIVGVMKYKTTWVVLAALLLFVGWKMGMLPGMETVRGLGGVDVLIEEKLKKADQVEKELRDSQSAIREMSKKINDLKDVADRATVKAVEAEIRARKSAETAKSLEAALLDIKAKRRALSPVRTVNDAAEVINGFVR